MQITSKDISDLREVGIKSNRICHLVRLESGHITWRHNDQLKITPVYERLVTYCPIPLAYLPDRIGSAKEWANSENEPIFLIGGHSAEPGIFLVKDSEMNYEFKEMTVNMIVYPDPTWKKPVVDEPKNPIPISPTNLLDFLNTTIRIGEELADITAGIDQRLREVLNLPHECPVGSVQRMRVHVQEAVLLKEKILNYIEELDDATD